MFRLTKTVQFQAQHALHRTTPDAGKSIRQHGHAYTVTAILMAPTPDPESGMIMDAGLLGAALSDAASNLELRLLNKVPGLEVPTMENIAYWFWQKIKPAAPHLQCIEIVRAKEMDGASYYGPLSSHPTKKAEQHRVQLQEEGRA